MNATGNAYGTSLEPGISEEVADLRRWGEYRDRFPVLRVPESERTLAQHIEAWGINDITLRRLMYLGVRDMEPRLYACAARLGFGPDDKPTEEILDYLRNLIDVTYREVWQERGPETKAYAAVHGYPVMR